MDCFDICLGLFCCLVWCVFIKAAAVFRRMNKSWSSPSISLKIKLRLFSAIMVPTAIYASETWKASGSINNRLDVFQQRCLLRILKIPFYDHITNEEVLRMSGVCKLHNIVTRRRLRLAGHVLRMENNMIPKTAEYLAKNVPTRSENAYSMGRCRSSRPRPKPMENECCPIC